MRTDVEGGYRLTTAVPCANTCGDEGPSVVDDVQQRTAHDVSRRETDFVPHSSTATHRRSSSSADQPPLATVVAICAHHRLRQSLFVRFGTCVAIACHFEGGFDAGSSARTGQLRARAPGRAGGGAGWDEPRWIASRNCWSSSSVHGRRSRWPVASIRVCIIMCVRVTESKTKGRVTRRRRRRGVK
jgi:hypothetical protein